MIVSTTQKFKTEIKNGVYVFHSPGCFTCEEHIKNMEEYITHFNLIEVDDIDFYESIGIKLTPCTIVFKKDVELFRKQGAFFNKQINELREYIKGD